jgi:acetolactate decarboxylase
MRIKHYFILTALFGLVLTGYGQEAKKIFQYASINSLMQGYYDGHITLGELKKHGDFGIGTYNTLDGEMILVENVFYRSQIDGSLKVVDDTTHTPFAVITNFKADAERQIDLDYDYNKLAEYIDSLLPNKNRFFAVRIDGCFDYVKLRTVPKQSKPYKKLMEIVKTQPTFELHQVKGIMVGYRFPEFAKGFGVPKYHFHFISLEKNMGGHVLQCSGFKGKLSMDYIEDLELKIPNDEEFSKLQLGDEQATEIKRIQR